jgi:very-short-patch-repair endonuclease
VALGQQVHKKPKKKKVNKIEEKVDHILKNLGVEFERQKKIDKYNVDFLVNGKYIVECYGDFWHCNPTQYSSTYFNRGVKKTAQEIWDRDNNRKEVFQKLGYKFLCLWESEIRNSSKHITSKIKKLLKEEE